MANLSADQETALQTLLQHLNSFTTPELIVTATDMCVDRPLTESGRARVRQAMAGAFAFGKIMYYIQKLREVDAERQTLGEKAFKNLEAADNAARKRNAEVFVQNNVTAEALAGMQEVTFHFWSICVTRISRLLNLTAKASGYKVPTTDEAILESYRPLRNYFEHLEDEVPGRAQTSQIVTETEDEDEWTIVSGFTFDRMERIVFDGKPIDITTRGLAVMQEILDRSYEGIHAAALGQVERHFRKHPEFIPTPQQVPWRPLIHIGRDGLF